MKIAGFELPEKIILNDKTLFLNGAAMRTKFFINTYIISLYAEKPILTSHDAIHSNIARSLRMTISTPLATPTLISQNIENGVKESLGASYFSLKHIVDEIKITIEKSNVGYKDTIDNFYDTDKSLYYYKNEQLIGANNTDGHIFGKALFDMYFGSKPKDEKIKRLLLKGF
jgi:hypothetical protein